MTLSGTLDGMVSYGIVFDYLGRFGPVYVLSSTCVDVLERPSLDASTEGYFWESIPTLFLLFPLSRGCNQTTERGSSPRTGPWGKCHHASCPSMYSPRSLRLSACGVHVSPPGDKLPQSPFCTNHLCTMGGAALAWCAAGGPLLRHHPNGSAGPSPREVEAIIPGQWGHSFFNCATTRHTDTDSRVPYITGSSCIVLAGRRIHPASSDGRAVERLFPSDGPLRPWTMTEEVVTVTKYF